MSQEDVQSPFSQRAQSLQPQNPGQHDNSYADPDSVQIEMGAGSMFNNDMDASHAVNGSPSQQLIQVDDNFEPSNDTQKITVGGLAGSQLNPRKSLTMSKSQMQKSQSGFDIGTRTAVGSFFSSIRHKKEGETQNFYDSEKMNGKEFVKKLIQQQEDRYHKKFAFERGQYHQCIPNPRKEKQMITVQLITRSLEGYGHVPPEDQNTDQMFDGDQGKQMPRIYNDQQHYQRYNLQPPGLDLNEQQDNGEGEGEGNENADDDDAPDKVDGLTDRTANGTSLYGEINPELYKPNKLADEEVIDPISGVVPYHYANIGKSKSQQLAINSCMDAKQLAVIAFWDLDPMDDSFKCTRFFLLPNPMKRNIIDKEGTQLDQVLYESTHTKEVFFFFKGYEMGAGEDIEEVELEHKLQIGFLRLEIKDEELQTIGEARHFKFHINNIVTIPKASILATQLTYLDRTSEEDQKQLPNPTMITTVSKKVVPGTPNLKVKGMIEASLLNQVTSNKIGRTLVFTAFLKEEFYSKDDNEENRPNSVENCWYPTIFFYDLDENKVVWEIFGAEQFISIDSRHRVTVLTNEIWTEISKDEYEMKIEKEEDFCRHWDYANWIWKSSYNALFSSDEIADRANKAPSVPTQNSYRLGFGSNKKLEITESVKFVEAHLHNMEKRVTLIYHGLGSFTFDLKTAKQLIEPGDWGGKFEKRKFHATMRLNLLNNQIEGEGKDEDNKNVSVAVKLNRRNNYSWQGQYETEDELVPIFIDDLDMNLDDGTMTGRSQEQDQSSSDFVQIDGTIGPRRTKNQTQIAKFRLSDCYGEKSFEGTINASTSKISGSWTDTNGKKYNFELKLAENVDADLSLKFENEPEINEQIQVDFVRKEAVKMPGFAKNFKLYAIGAVDQAQLCYFIPQVDVQFFTNNQDAYVQAKLNAIEEDDDHSNGKGVVYTTLVLYKVSDVPKVDKKKEAAGGNKNKKIGEPKARQYINFLLNQSFLKTQENKEWQLWIVNPSCISSDGRFFGSVIYEEMYTDELRLNFVTSTINSNKADDIEDLDFPQQPVDQTWIVDYPLLAYKTYTPMNKEIAIVHMALNMPQRIIHLGEWEFVCFVNHTQMIEQRLFEKSKETNCDIMFLVRRQGKIRLMSFKSDPWLKFDEPASDVDPDVYKQAIFMFSGHLSFLPSLDSHGNKILNYDQAYIQKYSRRFNNDKIQNAQLITKTLGGAQYYAMIIQFNDCIMQASFNSQIFISKCEPEQMVRRHLIRGYSEKIYYAETQGSTEKIFELQFHVSKPNQIDSHEIYQLAGSEIVAFEPDGENVQDDYNNEVVTQAFFIMDSHQKIYHLVNEGDLDFEINNLIDFSSHNKRSQMYELMENDWAHVHISERTLTFFDRTYNLNSLINVELSIPQAFFGEEKRQNNAMEDNDDDDNDDDDDDDDRKVEEEEQDWTIQNVQSMSMTTNMVAQCQRDHKEFCFLMKPAPGSRKINIVGFQQVHEVKQMLFVSNGHILVKFRDANNKPGKAVTLLSNGCMVEQLPRIQKYLDTNSSVVGESQITKGVKIVLLQQYYGENEEKSRLVALEFNKHGLAEVVGIFDEYKEKMLLEYAQYLQVQKQFLENFNENSKGHSELAKQTSMSLDGVMANAVVSKQLEGLKKKETQSKIKYAKEFFVTEKGEIIKMAAIVSDNPQVIAELEKDKRIESKDNKRPNFKSGENADTFISVFNMENTKLEADDSVQCQYKVIVFHCLNPDHQNAIVKSSQFSVVGDFLCYRLKSRRIIWCTKLKKDGQEFIPVNNFSGNQNEQSGQYNLLYTKFTSVCISLADMVAREDMDHIQMTEVPKAFFSTIQQRDGFKLKFFDNLLQVTIRSHGMIFNLDTNPIEEVDSIEDIDQLQKTDALVNTGFIMSASQDDYRHDQKFLRRIQIFTNEYVNLLFEKKQDRYADGTREHYISGMLFRTFAEVDLQQLQIIFKKIESRQRLDDIDIESVLSTYEGHTIFSIFADQINVFEKILMQLDDMEFPEEDNFDGQDCENSILRRLYRIMNLPVTDLLKLKIKDNDRTSEAEKFAAAEEEANNANCIVKTGHWVKNKLGIATNQIETGHAGFKSILKKSLHFENGRYRESLMEIALLCQENSINNFIDNLADIRILFTSMSPAVVEFFQNGFNETRFTKKIRNLDWTMGKPMKVIGKMGSVMTEREANWIVTNGHPGSQSETVQNRQVEAKVLMIDWIYASQGGLEQVGFRELVIELSKAPHESLFGTEFVQILVESFWDRYFRAILLRCCLPFLIYFFATNYYLQQYALEGIPEDERATFSLEFVLRWLILLSLLYFMFFEVIQLLRDRFEYFTDPYNYLDMSQYAINVYLILQTVNNDNTQNNELNYTTRALATLTIFLMWQKCFYWMRLFDATSFYIKLIRETLYDIRWFLILFIFILAQFGSCIMMMNEGRGDSPIMTDVFGQRYVDVIFNQYMLSLGEFEVDNFEGDGKDTIIWIIFILTTFITQVTFLNMLIAIMGDTFSRVTESKAQSGLREKIGILSDFVIIVKRESVARGNLSRFLFAISPKDQASDEGNEWEGTVTQLNKSMKKELSVLENKFSKRIMNLSSEITSLGSKTDGLSRELDEVKGSCQRLPKMEDIEKSLKRIIQEELKAGSRRVVAQDSILNEEVLNEDGHVSAEKTSEILIQAAGKKTGGGFGIGGFFGSK